MNNYTVINKSDSMYGNTGKLVNCSMIEATLFFVDGNTRLYKNYKWDDIKGCILDKP